jgi:hypothetical protein
MTTLEADIKAGEGVKNDLQKADMEARSLIISRQEVTAQVQKATQELQKARIDIKTIPDLHAELDSSSLEHQRLR